MRTTVIVIASALALGACSTTPPMQSALAPLAGQPVQLVINQLGEPTSQTPAGADTLYRWHQAKFVRGVPSANSLPASAEGSGAAAAGVAVPYSCDVMVLADSDGRIKDSQFGEETGGCRETAGKLRQLALAN